MKSQIVSILLIPMIVAAVGLLQPGVDVASAQGFDREACYAKCRCSWGTFQACADCKSECDRRFWKSFGRQLEDLDKSDQSGSSDSDR
ncbi:MAG: hypothetical protein AB1733_16750 [Thermodesulfobacteriota bacterium]